MTLFDIFFLFFVLVAVLLGIGLGFHLAFTMAQGKDDDDGYTAAQMVDSSVSKSKRQKKKSHTKNGAPPAKPDTKRSLKHRVHDQRGESFSEFDCRFTGEDHGEKLDSIRKEQETGYRALDNEGEKT